MKKSLSEYFSTKTKQLTNKLLFTLMLFFSSMSMALADNVLVIDPSYSGVVTNVTNRLQAAGHTVTVVNSLPNTITGYQQIWDLRYNGALSGSDITDYTTFVTNGGFLYLTTENPGCCQTRNNSVASLITSLGGGSTTIGGAAGYAQNTATNLNTTYMTQGIIVDYAAVSAIVNNQGIPLIYDSNNKVSAMSWIGRAGALSSGVTGTIVTVADINWLSEAWGTNNQQALDDIIGGIVAGTVAGTISANGNGAGATNGNNGGSQPTTYSRTDTSQVVTTDTMANGTFTGNGGTLQATSSATTVTNPITLTNDGMIVDSNGENLTIGSGGISGPGGLTFIGSGSTTIVGTQTYTGLTTVNSGATLNNNGDISSSLGVLNNGTFTNNGVTSAVANNGTFTNNGISGSVANTGTLVNNQNAVTGDWVNTGYVNNLGTMGNGTNYGLFANSNTVGTVDNQGIFVNGGTTGAVTNSGTFYFVSGTVSSINNSGTVDLSVMSGPSSLGSVYTQTSSGKTVIDGSQRFNVDGTVNLAGNLTILNSPTTIGRYTYLTAGNVLGQFDSLTSSTGVLRYVGNTVQLWVMPDGTVVQAQVDRLASNLNGMNSLARGVIAGSVGSDCSVFGEYGYCASINYGVSKAATGELASSGITVAKQLTEKWHVAMFGSQQLNKPTIGDIQFVSKHPSAGLTLGYKSSKEGIGLGGSVSYATGSGMYHIGSDKTGVNGDAGQVKLTYSMPVSLHTTVTPYVGLRYSTFNVNGYTEEGPVFPLTFNKVRQSSTDLLTGLSVSHRITEGLVGTVSAGVLQNLTYKSGTVSSTSDMGDFSSNLSGKHYSSMSLGAGMSYMLAKTQSVGVNFGWQQRSLTNASFGSMGVTYTVGF